jgi:hypothetical protein
MTDKQERAELGRQTARTEITLVIAQEDAGNPDAANETAVHAYHSGAKAIDLLREYHRQRSDQQRTAQNAAETGSGT